MDLVREGEIRDRVAAVLGSLTKGDLDICVSVPTEEFSAAIETLSAHLVIHQPENWTGGLASFVAAPDDGIETGVQLVVEGGSEEEWFLGWRERLRADPDLRARYDSCKWEHRHASVEVYRAAKERLILG